MWEKSDFIPRSDDLLKERLYCIQWMRPKRGTKRREYEFRTVTDADQERERVVERYVAEHWQEWQAKGWLPQMRIEVGGLHGIRAEILCDLAAGPIGRMYSALGSYSWGS